MLGATQTRRLAAVAAVVLCVSWDAVAVAAPRPVTLASTVVLTGTHSGSVDVALLRPVTLGPADLFDPSASVFDANRVGAGYALVSLDHAYDPPTLVGVMAPQADRSRRIQLVFGDDRAGNEILVTRRLPAGRYRLYLFTPGGATTVRFRLPGLAGGTRQVRPFRRETVGLGRADADGTTVTGSVLHHEREVTASQTLAVTTVAARITAPRGFDSYWCADEGADPPAGRYLPHCLGADGGMGIGNHLPMVGYEYLGLSAFVGLPPGRWGLSRSVEAVGTVEDHTSYFVWIPMPHARPATAAAPTPLLRGR